jgi:hypothetical protein
MGARAGPALSAAGVAAFLAAAPAPLPSWHLSDAAKAGFREIWNTSVAERRERVGCMAGVITADTVHVVRVRLLGEGESDSLTANAELSLGECAAPEWFGTVHTHVRSTDSDDPPPRFSPGDRTVMSEWSKRHGAQGAFCVLYSTRGAHCEVWPPRREPRTIQPGAR